MNSSTLRLLLVEDNSAEASLMKAVLVSARAAHKYEIEHVECLGQAIDALAKQRFDLALLDLTLPDSVGLATVSSFHAAALHTPFVVLTGVSDDCIALEALQLGAQDYLIKGKDSSESLDRCIRYAIQRHHLHAALALANRALAESEETLKLAIKAGNLVTWDWNCESDMVMLSMALPGETESPREPMAADELRKLVHPEDAGRLKSIMDSAIGHGHGYQIEYRIRLADGSTRWVADHGLPVEHRRRVVGITKDITETKEAELLRLEALKFQDAILDALPSQLAVLDQTGRITMVNQAWRRFADDNGSVMPNYGVGLNYLDVCSAALGEDEHAEAALNGLRRMIRGELHSWQLEYPCHSPEEERWFILRASSFDWHGGPHIVVSHENITQRHVAEEALRASQDRFERAVAGTSDGIWEWDLRTGYLWLAPRTSEVLGYAEGELPPHVGVFWDRLHPEDRSRVERELADHFEGSKPHYAAEFRLCHASGAYRWYRARGNASRDEHGKAILISGALEDITEEFCVQAKLKRFASIVESSGDAILSMSPDGAILTWNAAAERIYGYSAQEIVGKDIRLLVPADLLHEKDEIFARMKLDRRSQNVNTVRVSKTGDRIDVSMHIAPICDSSGELVGFSSIHRDMTEINSARRALDEKDAQIRQKQRLEAVGALAGGVAHEFNNLLQAILGYTRFALEGMEASDPRAEDLQQVVAAAERAAALTKQLLQFGRRDEVHKALVSPHDIVTDLAKLIRPLIGEQIELSVSVDDKSSAIFADAALISQMLMNLCLNARDALPHGGKLRLEAKSVTLAAPLLTQWSQAAPGRYVQFVVEDDGVGMTREVLERAFEPFFTTKPVGQGTGLGLPMVYGVTQQHDGSVDIISTPGRGTRFEIHLPAADSTILPADLGQKPQDAQGAGFVLVADDEPLVRDVASRILRRAGYQVITASDGEEAIDLLHNYHGDIHVAVLDMVMPKRTGRDVFNVLRKARPSTKTIFCSGYAPDPDFFDFLAAHDVTLLHKPFPPADLLQAMECTLQGPTCPAAHIQGSGAAYFSPG